MIRVKVKNNAVNVTSRSAVLIPSRTSELENDSDFQSGVQVAAAVEVETAARQDADAAKVDKVAGKGLSTNDYTDAEKAKLSGIETGAEVNTIETVKVNGTALTPDADKAVNIVVSVDPSDVPIATVKVNGTALVPDADKAVNVIVPTKTSDLTNDSGFQTAAQVASAVAGEASLREAADAEIKHIAETAFVQRVSSGDVAAFDDGANDISVADLAVELPYKSAGYTGCTVTRTGKNMLNDTDFRNANNWKEDLFLQDLYPTSASNVGYLLSTKPGVTYTFSFDLVGSSFPQYFYLCYYYNGNTYLEHTFTVESILYDKEYTFTAEEGKQYYLRMKSSAIDVSDWLALISWEQMEVGDKATDYELYSAQTYSSDWTDIAGTIYGGTWDVTAGVLTSTLDENGDALAQPVTYDLDPIAVKTRLGNNSVWSDAGAVSVTYRADPNLVIYNSTAGGLTSWKALQNLVRLGRAKEVLSVGDQLVCQRNGTDLVWDVLGIDCDTPKNPNYTHSLTICLHEPPSDIQFDAREALFYFPNGLPTGTYHFTVTESGVAADVNKTFQFTLTEAIPANGQLVLDVASGTTFANSTAKAYSSATSTTAIVTVGITEGTNGTSLGEVNNSIHETANSIMRALNGNNNYHQSAVRQYLNSANGAGSVWSPQNPWDRPPTWAANTSGFLKGVDTDFLAVIGEVYKKTALNTVCDGGGVETTVEKLFLLSQSEVYGGDAVTGGEGSPYPYYSNYSDLSSPGVGADSNRIKYVGSQKQQWRLRTPVVSDTIDTYWVSNNGAIYGNGGYARFAYVPVPACCIV